MAAPAETAELLGQMGRSWYKDHGVDTAPIAEIRVLDEARDTLASCGREEPTPGQGSSARQDGSTGCVEKGRGEEDVET
jgi:hypothetical protein